jgi:peptidoglycan/LPS O-acetylase OafA/YrhL
LDGLRAIAFLLVFGNHYLALPWGFSGVDAFFVLSGYLITGILYDTRNHPHRARNFYIRRTLRIFPLYYGLILLLILAYPYFRWEWNWKWLVWPAYLGNFARFYHLAEPGTNLQRLADAQPVSLRFPQIRLYCGHFWSLCIEEQFYLFWPWLVFWTKDRRKLMYLCLASIVVCTALRVTADSFLPAFMIAR